MINAFCIEVLIKFRWECPYCHLDQYSETTIGVGAIVSRVCEDPNCGEIACIKVEEEEPDGFK